MNLPEALAWLEGHVNLEAIMRGRKEAPTLDRIRELTGLMGDPHRAYPVVHITGTNGKGSTARMVTSLLMARGLSVGTYTSPDLQRVNERLAWNGTPIGDEDLADLLSALADLEDLMTAAPHRFDLLTAAAFRWFADLPVDAAVLEVGLGGLWDATNVADGAVAVVTNVELDHQEILGPTRREIATEKAGIIKPGSTLVLGETDADLVPIFLEAGAAEVWRRGTEPSGGGDLGWSNGRLAHGGRVVDLRTPGATYPDVHIPLHGSHQVDNAAVALAAVEAFFGAPMPAPLVTEAFASVTNPGRLEVIDRHPLLILDGAHNPAGARAARAALDEEFSGVASRVLVVGLLQGRDPEEMLEAIGVDRARLVIATRPPSPRAIPPDQVAAAARAMGVEAVAVEGVADAVRRGVEGADPADLVLVTGSLYVVGAARAALVGDLETHH
ncbi:MAG TPA: folylpolyglutamate synthase/dihydrofolate synthase family protein [Acidimicrobiales bacterium]|nr:folylpolyglutamate synthase/dihydrofolate synthase family protein [Acidimicrobiales bacterium]